MELYRLAYMYIGEEEENAIRLAVEAKRRRRRNEYTSIFQKNYVVTFWFEIFCYIYVK